MNKIKIIKHILRHTITDQVKQKSFIVISVLCGFFVLGIKSCYQGNYTINGQQVDGGTVALKASIVMFGIVATGSMMIAALFSMRIIKRERNDGTQSMILSKPVSRDQYITGKLLGLWIITSLFMFVLHGVIFAIGYLNTGVAMPEFMLASLICTGDLLFVISFVMLLSIYLPDFACFIIISALGIFSFIGDGVYSVSQNTMVQEAVAMNASKLPDISIWKILYYISPKLSTVQFFSSSFISHETFSYAGPLHPIINIGLYCIISVGLLLFLFRKQDIA